MQRFVVAITVGLVLTLSVAAPALADPEDSGLYGADQGCAIAVARTAGTPGAAYVRAACNLAMTRSGSTPSSAAPVLPTSPARVNPPVIPRSPARAILPVLPTSPARASTPVTPPQRDSSSVTPIQGVQLGCGIAEAQTAGTPGAPFVKAGCDQALSAVGSAPIPVTIPASPIQGVDLGCGIAIAQTAGTPGAAFVQAGCDRARAAVGGAPGSTVDDETGIIGPAMNIAILETNGVGLVGHVLSAWHSVSEDE